jgi:hypothetical protein
MITGKPEDDGFGYVALSETGPFSERWTDPDDAFKVPSRETELERAIFGPDMASPQKTYDLRGEKTSKFETFMAHGRLATCPVTIDNTHPFAAGDIWLVHNGMISDGTQRKYPAVDGTCDSESILKAYMKLEVAKKFENIQELFDEMTGSFACGVLAKDANEQWIMDVFLNDSPTLWGGVNKRGPVYCTNPEALHRITKCPKLYKVKGNTAIRFDIANKCIVEKRNIEAKKYYTTTTTKQLETSGASPYERRSERQRIKDRYSRCDEYDVYYDSYPDRFFLDDKENLPKEKDQTAYVDMNPFNEYGDV